MAIRLPTSAAKPPMPQKNPMARVLWWAMSLLHIVLVKGLQIYPDVQLYIEYDVILEGA